MSNMADTKKVPVIFPICELDPVLCNGMAIFKGFVQVLPGSQAGLEQLI